MLNSDGYTQGLMETLFNKDTVIRLNYYYYCVAKLLSWSASTLAVYCRSFDPIRRQIPDYTYTCFYWKEQLLNGSVIYTFIDFD